MFKVLQNGRRERFPYGERLLVSILLLGAPAFSQTSVPQSQSFGQVQVNAASPATVQIAYSFSGLGAAPTFSLSFGLDFSTGSPACTVASTVSCKVPVNFLPRSSGLRQDAVLVKNQSGTLIGTTFISGTGLAPQITLAPGIIGTLAGTGSFGYGGDGHAATAALLWNPEGIAVDPAGNVYIADSINQVIRKITVSSGNIATVAGSGDAPGFGGDGGLATWAKLNNPTGVALDGAGNLYIADQGNGRIREVNAVTGIIATVAGGGNGQGGSDSYGDGLAATSAILSGPNDVAVDAVGDIFIADSFHGLVREVNASTGIINVVAGGGAGGGADGVGDGGAATGATLDNPESVAVDAAGNVYIADTGDSLVRQVNTSGVINAIAGTGSPGYTGDLGPATSAELNQPTGVRVDAAGDLYIVDSAVNVVRLVTASSGIIQTVAGSGSSGYSGDNGSASAAALANPQNLALDPAGNLYIADATNNVVRKVTASSSALAFSSTTVGLASVAQFVTASNIGTESLTLSALSVSSNFSQKPSGYVDCSSSSVVAAGSNCVAAIAFAPSTAGSLGGTLTLTGNSLNASGASRSASLTGTGVTAAAPKVSLAPTNLYFGNQIVGTASQSNVITLSNIGSASLSILSIWLTGTNSSDFSLTTTCGASLAANASCTVSVSFSPAGAGNRAASLMFTDSVASSPQTVTLSGTGTTSAGSSFSTSGLNFGSQNVGASSAPATVTLTNNGIGALNVSSIALSGANASDFAMTTTCGSTLAASASCGVTLVFSPAAAGSRSATLSFTDNAAGSPQTVAIAGTGVTPVVDPPPPSVFFNSVAGTLSQISLGADGAVWGLNAGGQIYQRNATAQSWTYIPGNLAHLFVGSSAAVWGINSGGQIYQWNASAQTWNWIRGTLVQLSVGADGDVWGLNAAGSIYHFNAQTQGWTQISGTLAQIAVGYDGAVWGLNSSHSVFRFNQATQTFLSTGGSLTQLVVGADGDAWGLNGTAIFHFDQVSQTWNQMAGSLVQLAVGAGGVVYGLNASNQVCQYDVAAQTCNSIPGSLAHLAAAANGAVWGLDASGAIWTLNQPTASAGVLHQMPGSMSQLSPSSDGSVWALNSAGLIYHFDPSLQSWTSVPGALAHLVTGPNGDVWGLNASGQIFRFTPASQGWTYIPGTLAQLCVGGDGAVWGLNSGGQIYSFDSASQGWTWIPGTLAQLSVGVDGTVWGLNSGGASYRFDPATGHWQSVAGAFSQIAVGSKTNVWALGLQGQIYQFNSQKAVWQAVSGAMAHLAVGFDGAVWGLNSSNQVYRFDSQTQAWVQVAGSLAQLAVASDGVVWGLDSSDSVYRFQ
ncbi:MAG: choice-of-anchor D domain-containing protein [Acidobacteriaceae bacterium]|nr:choice-of-anchor D domain-containing protein [Acidobacteriaceae bacterium]